MLLFVARRLLYLIPVLIAVSLLTFFIASLLPGDLAYTILGDQATPENVAALRKDMGLDQPVWVRYFGWLGNILQGDFGRSFRTGSPVALDNYSNPELDKLLEQARATADTSKRTEDYCAISRIINKEAIWFWTFQNTYYAIATSKLKGLPKIYHGVIDVSDTWLE